MNVCNMARITLRTDKDKEYMDHCMDHARVTLHAKISSYVMGHNSCEYNRTPKNRNKTG